MTTITIPRRFSGPPDSANGGYAAGVLGALVDGAAEVTLRSPPPLDTPIELERTATGVRALAAGQLVGEAVPTTLAIEAPHPVSLAEATAASLRYPWRETHPYPGCFVCGPKRAPGDGLCLFPGAVEGREVAAAPFSVNDDTLLDAEGALRTELVWSLLDCPSWFGFACFHTLGEGRVLLGRLAARVDARPRRGDRLVAGGWFLGREGRKITCGSALWSERGDLLAIAKATWITIA